MASTPIPLYFGNEKFTTALDMSIKFPYENQDLFDDALMPMVRTLGVYGRKEMRKAEVVAEYCRRNNIDYAAPLEVKFGMTAALVEALDMQHGLRIAEPLRERNLKVIIISNADILVNEPADEFTMQTSLRLEEMAKQANWIIVGTFNRTKMDGANQDGMYRTSFFNQFPTMAILTCPDSDFRCNFYKQIIGKFSEMYKLTCTLTDEHYTFLAECSTAAAIDEMFDYCKRVIFHCLFEKQATLDFDRFTNRAHMSTTNRIMTLAFNAGSLDQKFTSMAGYLVADVARPAGPGIKRKQDFEPEAFEPLEKKVKEEEDALPDGFLE